MTIKSGVTIVALSSVLVFQSVSVVFAETSSPSARRAAVAATVITNVKNRADQEIARRIDSLNKLITRINAFTHVSDSEKSSLVSSAQSQISNLNTLKSKIDADTDGETLRTDVKSIFNAYRIYMLFIPQTRILAAADRMSEVADALSQVATKLQSRLTDAKNAGKDVTSLQTSLDDMNTKIADAKTQYANAESKVTGLTPDNGDTSVASANKAALSAARDLLKTGAQDLQTARNDAVSIRTGLRAFGTITSPKPVATP